VYSEGVILKGYFTRHGENITIKPKGLGLGFQIFEYLGFGFGYFANLLLIPNKVIKNTKKK